MSMFHFFKKETSKPQMPYATEVHCHILPGIDDGAPDVEHSIALIGQMNEWGVNRIIATPHVTEISFENNAETIGDAYARLTAECDLASMGMSLCYSAEYRMDDNFLGIVERNEIIPMPNNHVLIENSFLQPFWNIKELVFELQSKGYDTILAHPERYAYYYEDKNTYIDLHSRGCEFQVNLLSLAGYYGKKTKEVAEWLLAKGLIDYLGSDLHHRAHAEALSKFLTSKDYTKLAREFQLKNDSLI